MQSEQRLKLQQDESGAAQGSAHVGDTLTSLIHTAELSGANVLDYLVALLHRPARIAARPNEWNDLELPYDT